MFRLPLLVPAAATGRREYDMSSGAPQVLEYRIASEADAHVDDDGKYAPPRKLSVLAAGCRRLVPNLIEATLIPTLLFYLSWVFLNPAAAFITALGWSALAVGRRLLSRNPVPAIVLLAGVGIAARTLIALASGSTFVYFFQPVLGKVVLGGVFLVSVAAGRPLIARFAGDFCVLTPELSARPGIVRLYCNLTILWAGVNLAAAAISLLLLLTIPVGAFVAIKPFVGWVITVAGVILTVSTSVRVARIEGLLVTVSANGRLTARSS